MDGCYTSPGQSASIVYTPTTFAKTNLIHLQETGVFRLSDFQVVRKESHLSYLFFIVTDGEGQLEYDEEIFSIGTGDCVFLDCRKPYVYSALEGDLMLDYVYFYGPNMAGIYEKYLEQSGFLKFRAHGPKAYINNLRQLREISCSDSSTKDMELYEKLISLLTLLLGTSGSADGHPSKKTKKQDLQMVKDYLDQNYVEKITLDNLSERFFINKFYLTRLFKEQFGISVNNYLIQVRITHAKMLLRLSGMSIEKVGQECGINDANYFSRIFKKMEGISPGEYRKKMEEQQVN